MPLPAGTRLGPYEIAGLLGAGGMGEVYRARDTRLERDVAVKVLPPSMAGDPGLRARFEREARAVAALSHPNVLSIHDVGAEGETLFAVMELLEGENLRARLARGPVPWRAALDIAIAIADGVAAAHGKGIVHRDLKPENVFVLADGRIKVLDFGLAMFVGAAAREADQPTVSATGPGRLVGTLAYLAPEQVRGDPPSPASDVFAFGAVVAEMLNGRPVFLRGTPDATVAAVLRDEPTVSPEADAPVELCRVVRHCLEKAPARRFQSLGDCAYALRALRAESGLPAPRISRSRAARHRRLAVLPFVNTSGDAADDYLSEGLTDSVINSLAQLPRLRVVPRSLVYRYKDRDIDPRQAALELNATVLLTGHVVRLGDRVSVQAELIDAERETQLWGQRIVRAQGDVFALQEDIAAELAAALKLRLTGEERRRVTRRHTENSRAYDLYLRGRFEANRRRPDGLWRGIRCFEDAIAQDPGYALAWAGLAECYALLSTLGGLPPEEALPRARAAAERALELDADLAEAHTSLAFARMLESWDLDASERHLARALALNPNDATTHHALAIAHMARGRPGEADAAIRRAIDLDPLSAPFASYRAWVEFLAGRYDEAIDEARRALGLDERFGIPWGILARAWAMTGRRAEALDAVQRAREVAARSAVVTAMIGCAFAVLGLEQEVRAQLHALEVLAHDEYVSPFFFALLHASLGDAATALEELERAFEKRTGWLVYLGAEPAFASLHGRPAFDDLRRRVREGARRDPSA